MCRVWKAPATDSGRSLAPAGGSAANAASSAVVPAATIWPARVDVRRGQPVLLDGGQHVGLVAAEHRGHAGRLGRGGPGHRLAAYPDQPHRVRQG